MARDSMAIVGSPFMKAPEPREDREGAQLNAGDYGGPTAHNSQRPVSHASAQRGPIRAEMGSALTYSSAVLSR